MFTLSVSDPVRFTVRKSKARLTTVPLCAEFGKIALGGKLVCSGHWSTIGDLQENQVASPMDLLHAVVALYNTCLPEVTVQSLYRTVCSEGTKTLLLLRDTAEILQEWEKNRTLLSSASQSREDSLLEINNNSNAEKTDTDQNADHQKNVVITSPASADTRLSDKDHTEEDPWKPWTPRSSQFLDRFRPLNDSPDKMLNPFAHRNKKGEQQGEDTSPFSDIFSDSEADSESGSEMEQEEDQDDFGRGLDSFLRSVQERKRERRAAIERYALHSDHVGIEHRLIAAASFNKNYRIPGARIVNLSLIAVRKRFRKCGIGKFLLKRLKSPSQVGPYDALVVRTDHPTTEFFLKNNFTDDLILNSRFRELEIDGNPKGALLCYLPPFDGHYPPLPGSQEWNSPDAVEAMDEEIEKWRQKSLEAYQTQVTCLTRLQQEVLRLHNLLRRQNATIQFLKKENNRLQNRLTKVEKNSAQALIDALEKEAADIEQLCDIHFQTNESR